MNRTSSFLFAIVVFLVAQDANAEQPPLRPELNGKLVKEGNPAIGNPTWYLVDEGMLRAIPDVQTIGNLFFDNPRVESIWWILENVRMGEPIESGAVLARLGNQPDTFLVEGGQKRPILSAEAMQQYQFDWAKAYRVPQIIMRIVPTGASIDLP